MLILLLCITSFVAKRLTNDRIKDPSKCELNRDGFVILPDILTPKQIKRYQELSDNKHILDIKRDIHDNPDIIKVIREKIPPQYVFQDYIFAIQQSSVYTCHRDNNRKPSNASQSYDSYTILFFLKDMDRSLDVIIGSHARSDLFYNTDPTKSITVKAGSAILFDANLVHAGSFNETDGNTRIQMKLTHPDDREAISFYEKYNKYADKPNTVPKSVQRIHKHLSCQFPMASDLTQNLNIESSKPGAKKSWIQEMYSKLVYGDSNFYDLPDAK